MKIITPKVIEKVECLFIPTDFITLLSIAKCRWQRNNGSFQSLQITCFTSKAWENLTHVLCVRTINKLRALRCVNTTCLYLVLYNFRPLQYIEFATSFALNFQILKLGDKSKYQFYYCSYFYFLLNECCISSVCVTAKAFVTILVLRKQRHSPRYFISFWPIRAFHNHPNTHLTNYVRMSQFFAKIIPIPTKVFVFAQITPEGNFLLAKPL